MLRCNEVAIAAQFDVVLAALVTFLFGNSNLSLVGRSRKNIAEAAIDQILKSTLSPSFRV